MTVCIQCTMKAIVEGREPEIIEDDPIEHMRKCHPDPMATLNERRELMAKITPELMDQVMKKGAS